MPEFQRARIGIDVVAGLIPGQPMEEYTKRWVISSEEYYAEDTDKALLLATTHGQALGYAAYLMLQPDRLNWVRVDWVYF